MTVPRTHTITLIPGDGIGPEVTGAVVRILAASGVKIDWDRHDAGEAAARSTGKTLPDELLDSVRRNKVALKGPVGTPVGTGFTSVQANTAGNRRTKARCRLWKCRDACRLTFGC